MKKVNEFRVFGPPGTGKTSRLATRDVPRAIDKYGSDQVMVTSFTKAAAREITFKRSRKTGKTIPLPKENVGTMHSILYHAMGAPDIVEVQHIDEWNEQNPMFSISGGKVQSMDESCSMGSITKEGDKLLNAVNIRRNKLIPLSKWTSDQKKFYNAWCVFKQEVNAVDFTDLIEKGLYEFDEAPCKPSVIFIDEAQDFTKLQLTCIRNWGKFADWIVLVGDDDQCIYEFTGADSQAFINPPVADKYKTVLNQSWRVPRTVFQRALAVIHGVKTREEKQYSPRIDETTGKEAEGEVHDLDLTYNKASQLIDIIEPYLEKKMSIMFLASCSYMLEPIKKELRARALPFQNKYRRRRRDWNPLYHHGTLTEFFGSGIDNDFWNIPQFLAWTKHLRVGDGVEGLKKKVGKKILNRLKQAVEDNEDGLHTCREVIGMVLTETAVKAALNRDIDWYLRNIPTQKASVLEYPASVYKIHGAEGLAEEPLIQIGTIHSVKGAESDVVVLFPDVSYIADLEMGTDAGMDAALRLFYVGMTRAKHILFLCRPIVPMISKTPRLFVRL